MMGSERTIPASRYRCFLPLVGVACHAMSATAFRRRREPAYWLYASIRLAIEGKTPSC
jgi:hypothetical protein